MAINLLPSEEKAKAKIEKSAPEQTIAMTGPTAAEKNKPTVKRAGVLTFFKGAFSKPKQKPEEEAGVPIPERKVRFEEHVVYQPTPVEPKKIVTFQPKTKEEKKSKSVSPLPADRGGFFARFTRVKPVPQKPAAPTGVVGAEAFPRYAHVRTEHLPEVSGIAKKRNGNVIKVTTAAPEARSANARHNRPSLFKRIAAWLRSLFGTKTQEQQLPLRGQSEVAAVPPSVPQQSVRYKTVSMPTSQVRVAPVPAVPISKPPVAAPHAEPARPIVPPISKPSVPVVPPPLPHQPPKPVPPIPILPPEKKHPHEKKQTVEFTSAPELKDGPAPVAPTVHPQGFMSRLLAGLRGLFRTRAKAALTAASGGGIGQKTDVPITPAGMNWDVNLVPEEALEQEISVSRLLLLATFVTIAIGVVFGGWLWANWYFNSITTNINEINNQIAISDIQIRSYDAMQDEVKDLQAKITNVKTLLNKHIYWSRLFSKLEQHTTPDVYFTSLTADVNGSINLSAVGRNYNAAIKQLMVYNQADDFVSSVTISGITFRTSSASGAAASQPATSVVADPPVTFTVDLKVLPDIFYFTQTP